jgi:hypothetical protein
MPSQPNAANALMRTQMLEDALHGMGFTAVVVSALYNAL